MQYFDNGSFFTVTYSDFDSLIFARNWPGSTVHGSGSFQFDKRNGDLVDATGTASECDGSDWLAFSQDCQAFGVLEAALGAEKAGTHEAEVSLKFERHEDADRFKFVLDQVTRNACGKRSILNSLRRLAHLAVVTIKKL